MSSTVTSPVTRRRFVVLLAGLAVGLVLIVVGFRSSGSADSVTDTIAPLNLAVVGLIVAGAVEIAWLLGMRRHVSVLRDRVVEAYAVNDQGVADTTPNTGLVTVHGSTAFHRRDCLLVRGKELSAVVPTDELEPCALCGRGEP